MTIYQEVYEEVYKQAIAAGEPENIAKESAHYAAHLAEGEACMAADYFPGIDNEAPAFDGDW